MRSPVGVAYKGYEKMLKTGIKNVCVHKGLFSRCREARRKNAASENFLEILRFKWQGR